MQDTLLETPDIETSSDDYASRFEGAAGHYFLNVQERCVRYLIDDSVRSVLDVGGGHGQLTPIFQDLAHDITVVGSDESCHRRIKERNPDSDINFVTANLLRLPFEDRQFDLVIAVRLISHITAWQQLVAELCRVAKHTVIIDYPSTMALNALTPLMFKLKKSVEGNTRTYTSFSKRELTESFAASSFDVTGKRAQFFLPMFAHRVLKGNRLLQFAEMGFKQLRLTHVFGSPIILRADRRDLAE